MQKETVFLEFNTLLNDEIVIVLRDIQGKEYYAKVALHLNNGKLIGTPIGTTVPSGIYLIVATSNQQVYSQKLIVLDESK